MRKIFLIIISIFAAGAIATHAFSLLNEPSDTGLVLGTAELLLTTFFIYYIVKKA